MKFIEPMKAAKLPDGFDPEPGAWIAEEKFDGHRLIVAVGGPGLGRSPYVRGWSRNGLERVLPPHLRTALAQLPPGLYDGELLVPGERSYGVTVLDHQHKLIYVVFDLLRLLDRDLIAMGATWLERRQFLDEIFRGGHIDGAVRPSLIWQIENARAIERVAAKVWDRDGEGLILKRVDALYLPGKRPKNVWLKVKQLRSAVVTLKGFTEGKMGPHAVMVVEDAEGHVTAVKWKNLAELAAIDANPKAFIGRKLLIEYQERTPDGGYRHPRFDHWGDR